MENYMKVWRFEDAPKEYQYMSDNGGDEDWIVFVPDSLYNVRCYIHRKYQAKRKPRCTCEACWFLYFKRKSWAEKPV